MYGNKIVQLTAEEVSSVLNRDVRQFGKKFMFDGDEETCWNSDQGSPQYVTIELPSPAVVREVRVRFQGGFVGSECSLLAGDSGQELREVAKFYPKDDNSLQSFPTANCTACQVFKIVFNSSSDFFGRITIYYLQLYGSCVSQS